MACTLAAQAVTGAPNGPLNPCRIEIQPAARFTRNAGTVNGDSRRTPVSSTVRTASTITGNPPMPEATTVAVRSASAAVDGAHPAWPIASSAAARANWMNRSIFF